MITQDSLLKIAQDSIIVMNDSIMALNSEPKMSGKYLLLGIQI